MMTCKKVKSGDSVRIPEGTLPGRKKGISDPGEKVQLMIEALWQSSPSMHLAKCD